MGKGMKRFFGQPKVALAITLLLCIASLLLNTHVKLGRQVQAVEGDFTPLKSELRKLCGESENLVLLGLKQIDDTGISASSAKASAVTSLSSSTSSLRALLQASHLRAGKIYDAYEEVLHDLFTLESSLVRQDLSDDDTEALLSAQHEAAEAKAALDSLTEDYNDEVQSFNRRYRTLWSRTLAPLSGLRLPEAFA